jgi:DNA-binding MarR family transcriptional regulator
MDPIKEAFLKIKEEISQIKEEISNLRGEINKINEKIATSTNPIDISSKDGHSTDNQTHDMAIGAPYHQKDTFSIGNEGVPTDRQTNQQTNQQTQNFLKNNENTLKNKPYSDFKRANEILSSLDEVKKEIRLKFKQLTPQEMLVFSTLYALEEQNIHEITYKGLSDKLSLSESSIRDYINKLIKKGVPVNKTRQNNKTIVLKISSDLKNIASLATINSLRDL